MKRSQDTWKAREMDWENHYDIFPLLRNRWFWARNIHRKHDLLRFIRRSPAPRLLSWPQVRKACVSPSSALVTTAAALMATVGRESFLMDAWTVKKLLSRAIIPQASYREQ